MLKVSTSDVGVFRTSEMRTSIQLFALIFSALSISCKPTFEGKVFELVKIHEKSDIKVELLSEIVEADLTQMRRIIEELFQPVSGSNTVLCYKASYKGFGKFADKKSDFTDLLIVSLDDRRCVLDAYTYTLEWAEPPFYRDLYRSTQTGRLWSSIHTLEELDFRCPFLEKFISKGEVHGVIGKTL